MTKNNNIVENLLLNYEILDSGMILENHLRIILTNLKKILDENIDGDIVELGCNAGSTSLFIQRLLNIYKSNKQFHVYDSFEGLPEKHNEDMNNEERQYKLGDCKTKKEILINNSKLANIKLPKIHVGWFGKLPDAEYPKKIAFAFFDGDFYTSIIDSFNKVYPRMSTKSILLIHDYKWDVLPGVEKACVDFLKDKPEKESIVYNNRIGVMIKK